MDVYNTSCLIQRHGHRSSREAYQGGTISPSSMTGQTTNLSKGPGAVQPSAVADSSAFICVDGRVAGWR
jgi:hypothetical protein